MMKITSITDPQQFLDRAQAYLVQEESLNGLMLGIVLRLQLGAGEAEEAPFLLLAEEEGVLSGTAVLTPPHKLILYTHLDDCKPFVTTLTAYLHEKNVPVPGVLGPEHVSLAFAQAWQNKTGRLWQEGTRQGVYELREVKGDTAVSGQLRMAKGSDIGQITQFIQGYGADQGDAIDTASALTYAQELTKHKMLYVWEDQQVVSMAATVRPTPNGMSVNLVYTPPAERQKGYATACVAALSQRLLDDGCQLTTLFTDLANPIPNHIYAQIGYNKVAEFTEYTFAE